MNHNTMDMVNLVIIFGSVLLTYYALRIVRFWWMIFRCYFLTGIGFVKDVTKYGEWVVVTGATDGIGKEYARQFAKLGLKIVLVSRTKAKLEKVAKEIEEEFCVETKIICFDFSQVTGYENICEELSGLDVGILVNNVGTLDSALPFAEKDINYLMGVVNCNVTSEVQMTHMVLAGMSKRKWGLVIHISSSVLFYDLPLFTLYPATKAFMAKFWRNLQLEEGVIRHQMVTPFVVSTKLVPVRYTFHSPSAEDYVKSAIRTIGLMDNTCGHWFHEIQKAICRNVPGYVANCMMTIQIGYLFKDFTQ